MILKVSLLIVLILTFFTSSIKASTKFWSVQSVDTMKFSRDASRAPMSADKINEEVKRIADTGATYVAIDTPYDAEFLPRLKEWVTAARNYNLNVWFRGNFSGWEGWFEYQKNLTREKHLQMTKDFILNNTDLFVDDDIFTACPECENGGPGDPRATGDTQGFRKFMIDEYKTTKEAFLSIHKNVISNYDSMNGDVARLIMDKQTTLTMDGIVTIDHYVATPQKLISDIDDLAQKSGGKIVLGEYGAPIPDINGNQTEEEQNTWLSTTLSQLTTTPNLIGLNYWTDMGSSTSIWNEDGTARAAVKGINAFYDPKILNGRVLTDLRDPVSNVTLNYLNKIIKTGNFGAFQITYADPNTQINLTTTGYHNKFKIRDIIAHNNFITVPSNRWVWGLFDFRIWQ